MCQIQLSEIVLKFLLKDRALLQKCTTIKFFRYKFLRLYPGFYKKLSLGYHCRKLREVWRLVFSSALPSST